MGETVLRELIETTASRDAAFAYAADFDHQAAWDPNTRVSRRITPEPVGVGTRSQLEVRMGRGIRPMEYRITEYEPTTRVVLVGTGDGIWTQDTLTFQDREGGTLVTYEAVIRLSGLLGVAQPLLGRAFRAIAAGAASGLRRELDRLPTAQL